MWSIPGGKIEAGEATLDAAKRELREEVIFREEEAFDAFDLKWHNDGPFACSDSIHQPNASGKGFHYVISQCFVEVIAPSKPSITASDDATDARWWSADEVKKAEDDGVVTGGVLRVLERSELLYNAGLLYCN
jgi:ADP-ribose pyrophosphatase YjhB (NUDIX family)